MSVQTTKPLVDPNCLCGKPHPCPTHGEWVGIAIRPGAVHFDPVLLLWLADDEPHISRFQKEADYGLGIPG